jgi:hypothetical protein
LIPGTLASSSTLIELNWYEMPQLNAQESEETSKSMSWMDKSPKWSSAQVATGASSSEGTKTSSSKGVATTTDEMMGLETDPGGGSRSTSLAKREC